MNLRNFHFKPEIKSLSSNIRENTLGAVKLLKILLSAAFGFAF